MKLLVDMNLSPAWVRFLVAAGRDAVHWSEIGPADAEDASILNWAAEHDCVVLTADLDFGAILAATRATGPASCNFAVTTSHRRQSEAPFSPL
jgi:predicted nuclease of predicted toxin-antitoxin system